MLLYYHTMLSKFNHKKVSPFLLVILFSICSIYCFSQTGDDNIVYLKGAYVSISCRDIISLPTDSICIEIKTPEKRVAYSEPTGGFDFTVNPAYYINLKIVDSISKTNLIETGSIIFTEFLDTSLIKSLGYQNQWCVYTLFFTFSDGSRITYNQKYIVSYKEKWNQRFYDLENLDDLDSDDISDDQENSLAQMFAPVVFHSPKEINLPTNVDVFLKNTSLYIFDDKCDFPDKDIHRLVTDHPTQADLLNHKFDDNFCGSTGLVKSDCTKSTQKHRTFYLKDVPPAFRIGSSNTSDWITYFHAYKNIYSGITVQFWQLYSFNTGFRRWQFDFSHGGDWEGVQVILDKNNNPLFVDFLGHSTIQRFPWDSIKNENRHILVYSELGSHTCVPYIQQQTGIKQETWSGGKVFHLDGTLSNGGNLINVGEKIHPLNNQYFIQYSGLWGSPGMFYFTSGYWGPAYNETGLVEQTQFITAWCRDMLNADKKIGNGIKECFPCSTSR